MDDDDADELMFDLFDVCCSMFKPESRVVQVDSSQISVYMTKDLGLWSRVNFSASHRQIETAKSLLI